MYDEDQEYCGECDTNDPDECDCGDNGDGWISVASALSSAAQPMQMQPIMNYQEAMTKYQQVQAGPFNVMSGDEIPKMHQTIVFIAGNKDSSDRFRERAIRFATSLNTNLTIKADVVTIIPDGYTTGLRFTEDAVDIDHAKIKTMVDKRGWSMYLVLQEGVA